MLMDNEWKKGSEDGPEMMLTANPNDWKQEVKMALKGCWRLIIMTENRKWRWPSNDADG